MIPACPGKRDHLSSDGADNGLRIKSNTSRGGLVENVVYEDVCIKDTKNPIMMDSNYSYMGDKRDRLPTFTNIQLKDVFVVTPGKITLQGYDPTHRLGIAFNNVHIPMDSKIAAVHADVALTNGTSTPRPTGDDVHVTGDSGKTKPNSCEGKFVPLPHQ